MIAAVMIAHNAALHMSRHAPRLDVWLTPLPTRLIIVFFPRSWSKRFRWIVLQYTSHLTHHTPHTTPLPSHLTPHTSHLTPHTSESSIRAAAAVGRVDVRALLVAEGGGRGARGGSKQEQEREQEQPQRAFHSRGTLDAQFINVSRSCIIGYCHQ
jgi:hypothetical protein